eukprot:EG_transcript_3743
MNFNFLSPEYTQPTYAPAAAQAQRAAGAAPPSPHPYRQQQDDYRGQRQAEELAYRQPAAAPRSSTPYANGAAQHYPSQQYHQQPDHTVRSYREESVVRPGPMVMRTSVHNVAVTEAQLESLRQGASLSRLGTVASAPNTPSRAPATHVSAASVSTPVHYQGPVSVTASASPPITQLATAPFGTTTTTFSLPGTTTSSFLYSAQPLAAPTYTFQAPTTTSVYAAPTYLSSSQTVLGGQSFISGATYLNPTTAALASPSIYSLDPVTSASVAAASLSRGVLAPGTPVAFPPAASQVLVLGSDYAQATHFDSPATARAALTTDPRFHTPVRRLSNSFGDYQAAQYTQPTSYGQQQAGSYGAQSPYAQPTTPSAQYSGLANGYGYAPQQPPQPPQPFAGGAPGGPAPYPNQYGGPAPPPSGHPYSAAPPQAGQYAGGPPTAYANPYGGPVAAPPPSASLGQPYPSTAPPPSGPPAGGFGYGGPAGPSVEPSWGQPPAQPQPQAPPPAAGSQRRSSLLSKLFHWMDDEAPGPTAAPIPRENYTTLPAEQRIYLTSKTDPRDASFVEPVPLLVPADNAKQRIKHIVGSMPQSRIFVDNGPYLRFELVSPAYGAVDDVELQFDAQHRVIHTLLTQSSGPPDPQAARARLQYLFQCLQDDIRQYPHAMAELNRPPLPKYGAPSAAPYGGPPQVSSARPPAPAESYRPSGPPVPYSYR